MNEPTGPEIAELLTIARSRLRPDCHCLSCEFRRAMLWLDAERDRFRKQLVKIAALSDEGANEHLKTTGSYGAFDEPGSVEIARRALAGEELRDD